MTHSTMQTDGARSDEAIRGEVLPSEEDERRPALWRLSTWPKRLLMYPLLGFMALADAFVFWNTLVFKLQTSTFWNLIVVTALSLGAVTLCHEAGRMLRYRQEGQGGALSFIVGLVGLWFLLGLTVAWIRAVSPLGFSGDDEPPPTFSWTSDTVELAALMLVLYLVTGALSMAHGYRFGDPSAEVQLALERTIRRRTKALRRLKHDQQRAKLHVELAKQRSASAEEAEQRAATIQRAVGLQFEEESRVAQGTNLGSPSATSALHHRRREAQKPPASPFPDGYSVDPPQEGRPE